MNQSKARYCLATLIKPVKATQWFKLGDHSHVHPDKNEYDGWCVPAMTFVRPGDWIIEDGTYTRVLSDHAFQMNYKIVSE